MNNSIKIILVTLFFLSSKESSIAQTNQKPNVLIIYADDMGYGDLAIQNPNSKIPTPNLDKLAQEGMRFSNVHSSSGICTPSRYALLTGRYHWRKFHGIVNSMGESVIDLNQLTIAEMLKTKGYNTAAIGKWHLGFGWNSIRKQPGESLDFNAFDWSKKIENTPLNHGFDSYFGDDVINFPPYGWIENDLLQKAPDRMLDTNLWKPIKEGHWECRPGPMVSGWNPYDVLPTVTQHAVDYIKEQVKIKKPFFLYFALPSPHAPIIPNDEFDGKSKAGAYGDFVNETDFRIGQILKALKESGQEKNTIVIFSADNGSENYAYERDEKYDHWSSNPFRGVKRDVYEGGHHVPFIVKWPGVAKPGKVTDALMSQVDIMATLAALVDYKLPNDQAEDSYNLLPLIKGESSSGRESIVYNTFEEQYGIRVGDWVLLNAKGTKSKNDSPKWIKKHGYPDGERQLVELYNMKVDVEQKYNLASKYPEKVIELEAALNKIRVSGYSAPRLQKK